jgi:hypothetical protein
MFFDVTKDGLISEITVLTPEDLLFRWIEIGAKVKNFLRLSHI